MARYGDMEVTVMKEEVFRNRGTGTSLVVQGLRICLAMQGTQVRSLVRKLRSHMTKWDKLSLHASTRVCMLQLRLDEANK